MSALTHNRVDSPTFVKYGAPNSHAKGPGETRPRGAGRGQPRGKSQGRRMRAAAHRAEGFKVQPQPRLAARSAAIEQA